MKEPTKTRKVFIKEIVEYCLENLESMNISPPIKFVYEHHSCINWISLKILKIMSVFHFNNHVSTDEHNINCNFHFDKLQETDTNIWTIEQWDSIIEPELLNCWSIKINESDDITTSFKNEISLVSSDDIRSLFLSIINRITNTEMNDILDRDENDDLYDD